MNPTPLTPEPEKVDQIADPPLAPPGEDLSAEPHPIAFGNSPKGLDSFPKTRSVQSLYRMGQMYHDQGQLEEAALFYRQALSLDPTLLEAYNDLGTISQRQGRFPEAVVWYRTALTLNPLFTEACYNLGNAYKEMKEWREAEFFSRRAVELDPNLVEGFFNLGVIYYEQEKLKDAVHCWQKVIQRKPDHVLACVNLATALEREKRPEEAVVFFARGLELDPNQSKPWLALGKIHEEKEEIKEAEHCYRKALEVRPDLAEAYIQLGLLGLQQGSLDDAVYHFEKAVNVKPDSPEYYCNLGNAYQQKKNLERAADCYRKAIQIRSDYCQAHNNLGLILHHQGRLEEALNQFNLAMGMNSDLPELLVNIGNIKKDFGEISEGIKYLEKALAMNPEFPEAHWNFSLVLLTGGYLEQGWREYEWRWKLKGNPLRQDIQRPLWKGEDLKGKRILLFPEQGFGDTIQFCRFVPMVIQRNGRVILECQPELKSLLSSLEGIGEFILYREQPPDYDVQCSLLSLPLVFHTSLSSIPQTVPYLHPDPGLVKKWRMILSKEEMKKKIGLIWAGRPEHVNDRNRSLMLKNLAPLFLIPGIQWFSLQKGEAGSQIKELSLESDLWDCARALTDFSETAALIQNLDLVISVDTAVAHLAGALGKPVWTLLHYSPDWRWMLKREDSPWYPTMRLFRQSAYGDWGGVIEKVGRELENVLKRGSEFI
jgi:tetratricopeptide (TPR) repeat protein